MSTDGWKDRLRAAVKESGKSARSISLASGNGPGYVHSILKEGKDPTIENLMAVCDQIPVSLMWVLYGAEVDTADIEILRAMQDNPDKRAAILALLRPSTAA